MKLKLFGHTQYPMFWSYLLKVIPRCPSCPPDCEFNILKPDIVFFGESLPEEFQQFELDKDECDLLIVMGSSLIVRPVAIIPSRSARFVT